VLPPPDPPAAPFEKLTDGPPGAFVFLDPPTPPPADVIVEKTELLPLAPTLELGLLGEVLGAPEPPPPTVIGKAVAETVIIFPGVPEPSKGLAVKGAEGELTSLKPPAPAPPAP
tara:strand:- start:124 stop:465 length:342 start_codon:yes stop_codon:yes gene_type:complete